MKERKCLECGFQVIGRPEKIFCSDTCRTRYNNSKYKETDQVVIKINRILKKNRKIILKFLDEGFSGIHQNELLQAGFDFNYFTSIRNASAQDAVYYCYDVGYSKTKEGQFSLFKEIH